MFGLAYLDGLGDAAPCPTGFVRDPKPGGDCYDLSTMCPQGENVCPAGTWVVSGINAPWGQYALPGAGGVIANEPVLNSAQTTIQQIQAEQAAGIAPVVPLTVATNNGVVPVPVPNPVYTAPSTPAPVSTSSGTSQPGRMQSAPVPTNGNSVTSLTTQAQVAAVNNSIAAAAASELPGGLSMTEWLLIGGAALVLFAMHK